MKDFRLESCWRAWLALLVGLMATGYLCHSAKTDAELLAQQQFAAESDEIRLKILSLLEAHKQVLLGGAALFNASHYVDRDEWKNYVSLLRLDDHFKGIQGIGFSLWIPRDRLDRHIASIRQQGFPDYTVRPAGARAAYSPIVYLEPFDGRNLRAFGFDMYSESVRRAAMERARDENMAALSGKVTLMQETDRDVQAGTLMYVPIYLKSAPLQTIEQRRSALYGWVYSPFRMTDLLREILSDEKNLADMHIQVFAGAVADPDNQLFNSTGKPSHLMQPDMIERHLTFGGQEWTLLFEKYKRNSLDYSKAWWVLIGGMISSILLFFLIAAYMGMRKALRTADTATAELRRSEENFRVLAKNESVLVWMSGPDKKCYSFNQVWLEFTGRTLEQEMGDGWIEGVHPDDLPNCLSTYLSAFDAQREFTMEYRLRRHDGEYRWIIDHGVPRIDHGNFIGYIGSCIDITDRKRTEEQIHTLAYFDALTKLPNRRMLNDRLSQAIATSRRSGHFGALLFIDLDNFKPLNDSCGHAVGDLLLIQVAERLTRCVRAVDTVARFGGDEFVVVMGELTDDKDKLKTQATIVSEKILAALAAPYVLKLNPNDKSSDTTIEHHCTSSIGVTLFTGREDDPETILRRGDMAMYQAKTAGRNQISFYE
ncbi:MAG: GGDEF domain-containing protein [Gallionella sp.]|nr:GGDEF domain-containing protein [Gallionella sp.]